MGLAALIVAMLSAAPASAQPDGSTSFARADREHVCAVREREAADQQAAEAGVPKTLFAFCDLQGALLGEADEYSVIANAQLGAMLVELRRAGNRRVLMVSLQGDRKPLLVEDLGGQIAMAAGKGPTAPIDEVEIDAEGFAREGTIAVRGSNGAGGTIRLQEQVLAVRAYRAAEAEQ